MYLDDSDAALRERLRARLPPPQGEQLFACILLRASQLGARSIECTPLTNAYDILLKIDDHALADALETQLRLDFPATWCVAVA